MLGSIVTKQTLTLKGISIMKITPEQNVSTAYVNILGYSIFEGKIFQCYRKVCYYLL